MRRFAGSHPGENLLGTRGRFTARNLADWAWNIPDPKTRQGPYTAEQQALFLQFMQACGMCFEIRSSEWGTRQAEYLLPPALPDDTGEIRREAQDHRGEAKQSGKPVTIRDSRLGREAVLELLVKLGREWRGAPVLWRWGGQFQSYRRERRSDPPTFVLIDWREDSKGSYRGSLSLTQYGPDQNFLAAILNLCGALRSFAGIDVPKISVRDDPAKFQRKTLADSELADVTTRRMDLPPEDFKTYTPLEQVVEIGISFAGDQPAATPDWTSLPENSIEKWPLALAARLRREPFNFKVMEYRGEQLKPEHEKDQGRKEALEKVASRDYQLVFLSRSYLESVWCMFELMRVFTRMTDGIHDPYRLRVGKFADVRFSQTNLSPSNPETGMSPIAEFLDYWREWLQKFEQRILNDALAYSRHDSSVDPGAYEEAVKSYAYADWYRFLRNQRSREMLANACSERGRA